MISLPSLIAVSRVGTYAGTSHFTLIQRHNQSATTSRSQVIAIGGSSDRKGGELLDPVSRVKKCVVEGSIFLMRSI